MEFYSMEQFEIYGDAMDEVREWADYEADMTEMDTEENYPDDDPWDFNLEMGFNPYEGCYDFDC